MLSTLVLLLARLGRLNDALVNQVCTDFEISSAELRTLACLRYAEGRRGTPTELARLVVQTSGGLTATLRRLEARGAVERAADETDGRGRPVVLTDAGAELHDRAFEALVARYDAIFDGVDVDGALTAVRSLIGPLELAMRAASSAAWAHPAPEEVSA